MIRTGYGIPVRDGVRAGAAGKLFRRRRRRRRRRHWTPWRGFIENVLFSKRKVYFLDTYCICVEHQFVAFQIWGVLIGLTTEN